MVVEHYKDNGDFVFSSIEAGIKLMIIETKRSNLPYC